MNPAPDSRLPLPLDGAVRRVKLCLRAACERTIESLGLSALASMQVQTRDAMLGAQYVLEHQLAQFTLAFDNAFDAQVRRECLRGGGEMSRHDAPASWDALSLVEDREVEIKVRAERFGLEITHACEWELRELEGYVASVLGHLRADRERNPLRPEIVGHAMIHAADQVADRPAVHKALTDELTRSLTTLLRTTYGEIVSDLRKAGIQPAGMSVRTTEDRGEGSRAVPLDPAQAEARRSAHGGLADSRRSSHGALGDPRHSLSGALHGGLGGRAAGDPGPSSRGGLPTRSGGLRGTPIGQVDPGMMDLLRRLAHADVASGAAGPLTGGGTEASVFSSIVLPNLIHAHREELRQASRGAIDHMVIDVIASLFDQILSDPKVPPQMARQIGRLQLPVLRAALGDPSFFSSRKHPVRRFVNRIATLGAGFDDFSAEAAQQFLAKVRELVQEIVEGEFDQIETYETKLTALENFVAEQARAEVRAQGDAESLLSSKEDELRLRQHYANVLHSELPGLASAPFVHDFLSQVWSQVLLEVAKTDGPSSERLTRLRAVARELYMSVQPKTSPAQRKAFLAQLPKLMQQLNEGMDLVGWPDAERRTFFGQLLPAHAEALKAQIVRTLDFNMLARQVEQVLDKPLPRPEQLPPTPPSPIDERLAIAPQFSAEEARRVGLVDEATFDWNGQVDIDLSAEPEVSAVDLELPGLPAPKGHEESEPTSGRSLADHVQVGFSYQMHLEGEWQKVRLAHFSPGRTFFVFTRGTRHQRTISLTHRMLVRLCETGRLRAFESAYLIERATARTRRQLASLGAGR